ncbi:hypothetical protein ACHAQH_004989 [Verticillium albo-atrum]
MASDAPRASGGSKFFAFLDLVVKLAATGALIGILVLLLKINDNLSKVIVGDNVISVGLVNSGSTPLPISAIVRNDFSTFSVSINNNPGESAGDPLFIRNVDL